MTQRVGGAFGKRESCVANLFKHTESLLQGDGDVVLNHVNHVGRAFNKVAVVCTSRAFTEHGVRVRLLNPVDDEVDTRRCFRIHV